MRKKVLVVFGTRPEAIKLCPLIKAFGPHLDKFEVRSCTTAQHREMLDQVLKLFLIQPDYDLNLMKPRQDLFDITAGALKGIQTVLDDFRPDFILVQGDTTTAFVTSLAAFYLRIPVGHVEAGLRTGNKYSPWPEEVNRCLIGNIADLHFAPTESSRDNLLKENKKEEDIFITGNTVVDALFWLKNRIKTDQELRDDIQSRISDIFTSTSFDFEKITSNQKRMVLITGHRRENFGSGFINICKALRKLGQTNTDVDFVYPVHLNPNVREPVYEILSEQDNVHLIQPLEYEIFIYLMEVSSIVLTDSGGIQEEAPSLGKPVLVMRNTTERPEAVQVGTVKLVGTDEDMIFQETMTLLHDPVAYDKMARAHNPYGDGNACMRIIKHISEYFRGIA